MMEYLGCISNSFLICVNIRATAKNSLFVFTKCFGSWGLLWRCAFILRICRFNTCHTLQTNKSSHPALRQTILERNTFLNKKKKRIKIFFSLPWKIIASFAVRASARIFSSFISSAAAIFLLGEYFFCNFTLHWNGTNAAVR